MLLAMVASVAIVVTDHASVRSTPRSGATELMTLSQGDVVEVRGEQAEYLKVYSHRRERGGYIRSDLARRVTLTEAEAPELLAVLRFLSNIRGSEALGISYGAAYLKAAPPGALTAEPLDAIGQMAERLADLASGKGSQAASVAERLETLSQFGIHMRSFERDGRMQVCYDGELYRSVLTQAMATAEQRARATLGLTRPDCIDPAGGAAARAALEEESRLLLERLRDDELTPATRSQVHARRTLLWSAVAYQQARHGEQCAASVQRAIAELTGVRPADLGEIHRSEYLDALLRVSTVRWAVAMPVATMASSTPGGATQVAHMGAFALKTMAGTEPGQTCVALEEDHQRGRTVTLSRRCTFGIVWLASARALPQGPAAVLSVQPLESWSELWVFHRIAGHWIVDVLSPGADEPEEGYVEYAGFAPVTRRLLLVREVKERSRFRRWFEEVRLEDLLLVRQASSPELLRDFGRWQDADWRRETLALH